MKVGVLSSSRADYGIYLPLLVKLELDPFFELEVIAFGTHQSKFHGFTLSEIEQFEYNVVHKISSLLLTDDEQSISTSYGLTALKFADFWKSHTYDLVFCLGDRFEMNAAVQSAIPYGIKFAHIHGGEITLGSIDNIYRHQITLASSLHFTASEVFSNKVIGLIGNSIGVHTVGSLSLDGLEQFTRIDRLSFYKQFNLPNQDFALITFHPETVDLQSNKLFAIEMRLALTKIISKLFLVITMPNADTLGSIYRSEIDVLRNYYPNSVLCVENFGREYYFAAMKYAKLLIGNSSSGIIEAASFSKYVVNVGNRQKGRLQSQNVFNVEYNADSICELVHKVIDLGEFTGENVYRKDNVAVRIIDVLKKL